MVWTPLGKRAYALVDVCPFGESEFYHFGPAASMQRVNLNGAIPHCGTRGGGSGQQRFDFPGQLRFPGRCVAGKREAQQAA